MYYFRIRLKFSRFALEHDALEHDALEHDALEHYSNTYSSTHKIRRLSIFLARVKQFITLNLLETKDSTLVSFSLRTNFAMILTLHRPSRFSFDTIHTVTDDDFHTRFVVVVYSPRSPPSLTSMCSHHCV